MRGAREVRIQYAFSTRSLRIHIEGIKGQRNRETKVYYRK